ncbi:MAG: hypothetical protein SVY15_06455 [Halobacteriota archaeon]|nr:hypothetical protein [Halobacteriota archaeon]
MKLNLEVKKLESRETKQDPTTCLSTPSCLGGVDLGMTCCPGT